MPKKFFAGGIISLAALALTPAVAFAHVVVTPAQADVGASTLFNVSVPNEKEVAVTSVKLDIPKGVEDVQPDVLTGWTITTGGSDGKVASITWTGNIPVGERADFTFKAQAPANATELDWKAYQTYADGTVVQWDQNPAAHGQAVADDIGPYSITKVVNDLTSPATTTSSASTTLPLVLSIAALAISIGGLLIRKRH